MFFIVFVLGGLYFGYIFVYTASFLLNGSGPGFTKEMPPPPGPFAPQEIAAPWSGKDRLNILLLGLDQREEEKGMPSRSDTIIVLTIDPVNKTATMLSIPRDLWVSIPGQGENKINTAHFFGEIQRKDSGPVLAKKTIEANFGIPINYYARVNFRGFEQLIDALGGIDIDVPSPVLDDEYPQDDGVNIKRLYVPAGWQHMDGELALEYARSRHADSDFGRNQRQQQVLVAAKNRALQVDMWPKLPGLIGLARESITTDIPAGSILSIAQLARSIDSKNISSVAIDGTMVNVHSTEQLYYLEPKWPQIKDMIASVFTKPVSPDAQPDQQESARISVLNGTSRVGLAAQVGSYLKDKGFVVASIDDADKDDYAQTTIIDHANKAVAANNIAKLLGVPSAKIARGAGAPGIDITVILGKDASVPAQE
jgi:polyisoprenyl-teichoic acid--peptidoglycan teichoic acid transferase